MYPTKNQKVKMLDTCLILYKRIGYLSNQIYDLMQKKKGEADVINY